MPRWISLRRSGPLIGGLLIASLFFTTQAYSQRPKAKAKAQTKATIPPGAEGLLKLPARPKRADLPPSKLPLEFIKGERIALVGNSTAERMNLFGDFETRLQLRFAGKDLVVRNFGRPADEVGLRQRANDYTRLDDPLRSFGADTMLCFFGFNESFAGPAGVDAYQAAYDAFLDEYAKTYPRDDAGSKPRFVLISPIAFEPTGDPLLPEGSKENANLKLYADATKAVAEKRGLAYVDIFTPTLAAFTAEPGMQYTINGAHVQEAGDTIVGATLDNALFGKDGVTISEKAYAKLKAAVNDKSWVHLQDYRMLNGWYVYGGRRTWDTETFPREYLKIRNMAKVRDKYVWDIAQGKQVADKPDDSETGDLITPATRFGESRQKYSEDQEAGPRILPPDEFIKTASVPPGFEIKLFADETKFPELAKPVQMSFDSKGRLWVSTMPSYPQWKPGDPRPSDKLVILEDTDKDGKADKSTIFYDKLHCPTGFEFFDGGVLVVDQPRIIFLKDTDGDDKADKVTHVLDGFATEDTHHTVGAFEMSPSGLVHMLEGIAMSTTVETPWGPFRNFGSSGAYVLDPRTWKIRHFNTPGYGNPWCYVFNEWGQGICGDGTGAAQHWDTPLSSKQYPGRKGLNPVFDTEGMRPVVGSDFLVSRAFPDDVQGQFIYACVINMNGIPRWEIKDDGAGYHGTRVRKNPADRNTAYDLIKSTDKHFRPVDPMIGPDGALWFGDWANPLIGHMQYSQRDPYRDHIHGRVYRLVYKEKPLLTPITQDGKGLAEVFDQLKTYEWRTRYHARRAIQAKPKAEALAAAKAWLKTLDPNDKDYDRLRTEALWTQESYHAVDLDLLKSLLKAKTADARAAATRVLADERDRFPEAFALLAEAAKDAHPRVTTEALRGLSYFETSEAANAVLAGLKAHPGDYYVNYTADAAMGANLDVWRGPYLKGEIAGLAPNAKKMLDSILAMDKKAAEILPWLQVLLGRDPATAEQRNKAMQAISDTQGGNAERGRAIFRRSCTACHKALNEGADFGPNMEKVGTRLTRYKIVESIIEPNAELDPKYNSTSVAMSDGKVYTGLLAGETPTEIMIYDGKQKHTLKKSDIEERRVLKQSSMPEGLAAAMSPVELLDVVTFLHSLK